MLYIVRDIKLFGSPDGYDGRSGESTHKHTKKHARHTHRRAGVFEFQTGMRLYESLVIEQSDYRIMHQFNVTNKIVRDYSNINVSTASGYVIGLNDDGTMYNSLIEQDCSFSSSFFYLVCKTIFQEFSDKCHGKEVLCRHYFKVNDFERYHAHPQYRGGLHWYDWGIFSWVYNNNIVKNIPGMICAFVDLSSTLDKVDGTYESQIQVCLISLSNEPKSVSRHSKLFNYGSLEVDEHNNLMFRFVDIDSLAGSCFAVPNVDSFPIEEVGFVRDWIFVENRYLWNKFFI